MKLELYKPKYRTEECLSEIKECLREGCVGVGEKTTQFEYLWKEYANLPHALFLNSGSSSLFLAIKALKIKNDWSYRSEIISTPFTWIAPNYAISQNNLKVTFADIDESLNLDPESVKKKINQHTKAILFVGVGGNPKNLDKIANIAKKNGLKLILDGSHMAGSHLNKVHVGREADASIFSFNPTNNIPTADGGMLCMKSEEMHELVKELSFFGFNEDRTNITHPGFKYSPNSLNAALGIIGLKYLDHDNEQREKIAQLYEKTLGSYSIKHNCISSRHLYQIVVEDRDTVQEKLEELGIQTGIHYERSTKYPPYTAFSTPPNTSYYIDRVLSLSLHLQLTEGDVVTVADSVKKIIKCTCECH